MRGPTAAAAHCEDVTTNRWCRDKRAAAHSAPRRHRSRQQLLALLHALLERVAAHHEEVDVLAHRLHLAYCERNNLGVGLRSDARHHLHSKLLLQRLVALQEAHAALQVSQVLRQRPRAHISLGLRRRRFDKAVVAAVPVFAEAFKQLFEREAAARLYLAAAKCAEKVFKNAPSGGGLGLLEPAPAHEMKEGARCLNDSRR